MAVFKITLALTAMLVLIEAQRPFYAGLSPIGYPQLDSEPLSNRFGEDSGAPIEAKGDGNLINRLNRMPIDSRPFWYLNYKQYEELRKKPQTYPLRPNNFIDK